MCLSACLSVAFVYLMRVGYIGVGLMVGFAGPFFVIVVV